MYRKLSAWVLSIIITAGMVWLFTGGVSILFSEDKNVSLPEKSVSLLDSADSIIDDRLAGFDRVLKIRTELTLVSGLKKAGNVYISSERLLREPEIIKQEDIDRAAKDINSFYKNYDVPICVAVIPEAAEIYTDSLPENVSVPSQISMLDRLYENLDTKIRAVDAYHVLSTFRDDYIYYRTDSGCTSNGAYLLYRSLIRKMGYYPVPYDKFTISHVKNDIRGDLYDVCLYDKVTPDILDIYSCENSITVESVRHYNGTSWIDGSLYDTDAMNGSSADGFYIGQPCMFTEIKTNAGNDKKLLVIKDRYGDNMLPFLIQHYSQTDVADISCLDRNIGSLTDPSEYQQVLILCGSCEFTGAESLRYISGNQ